MYSADEQAVLDYLGSAPNSFFTVREVCRRAGGKEKWEKEPRWAFAVLTRLLAQKLVEADACNHYRIVRNY